jgi:hypothetical protein
MQDMLKHVTGESYTVLWDCHSDKGCLGASNYCIVVKGGLLGALFPSSA